ncbi:MAG: HPF/RaiA family ribosome-associated protein [Phycisphaerales bacterium]|nr:HPF/RaiA family ribosome-associated protein [Phycisphaerales bacterium]
MQIRLFDGPMATSSAVLDRITSRLTHALQRFGSRIREVEVRLADVNGGKGGDDKRVRMLAHVAGLAPVAVEAHHHDYYAAIDGAADKLKRAVTHSIARHR